MGKRLFKTTQKSAVGGPVLFRGWKEWKEGDYVIGEHIRSYETEYRKQMNPNWVIRVAEANFKIKNDEGKLVSPVGQDIVLNSAGTLNALMKKTPEGHMVEVVYGGKKPGREPDTEYHTFATLESGPRDDGSAEEATATTSEDNSDDEGM